MTWIAAGVAAAGRSMSEIDVAPCFWFSLADDRRAAQDAMRRMIASYGHYLRDELLAPIGLSHDDFVPLGRAWAAGDHAGAEAQVQGRMFDLAILGSVDDVTPRLQDLIAQGVTQINVGPPLGPDPRRSIALLGERLLPRLSSSTG
jgi:5,10-methylenetetrahydromethanopterin reductase